MGNYDKKEKDKESYQYRKQESEEKQPPTDNHLQEDVDILKPPFNSHQETKLPDMDMSKFNNKTQKYLQEVLNKWQSNPKRGFHNYDKKEKDKESYQYRKQESEEKQPPTDNHLQED